MDIDNGSVLIRNLIKKLKAREIRSESPSQVLKNTTHPPPHLARQIYIIFLFAHLIILVLYLFFSYRWSNGWTEWANIFY